MSRSLCVCARERQLLLFVPATVMHIAPKHTHLFIVHSTSESHDRTQFIAFAHWTQFTHVYYIACLSPAMACLFHCNVFCCIWRHQHKREHVDDFHAQRHSVYGIKRITEKTTNALQSHRMSGIFSGVWQAGRLQVYLQDNFAFRGMDG